MATQAYLTVRENRVRTCIETAKSLRKSADSEQNSENRYRWETLAINLSALAQECNRAVVSIGALSDRLNRL